jgi:hypothetical protein
MTVALLFFYLPQLFVCVLGIIITCGVVCVCVYFAFLIGSGKKMADIRSPANWEISIDFERIERGEK